MASIELGTNTCWEKTHTMLQSKASVFDMTVHLFNVVGNPSFSFFVFFVKGSLYMTSTQRMHYSEGKTSKLTSQHLLLGNDPP